MVNGEVEKVLIDKDNMLEIIDQALSIEKEHGRCEKIPILSSNPGYPYQFRTLKKGIFFSLAGTLANAMTSLYTMI